MKVSNIKNLFLVAFLGLTLVGCSSTPNKDNQTETKAPVATGDAAAKAAQAKAAQAIADQQAAAKLKAENLFAQLNGKVVHFAFDRSQINSDYYNIIKLNADYLAANKDATVTLKGYCDERGTREYNLALGERRAVAVKNALITAGVSPSRIRTISYGEEDPIATAHNESAWAQNRRVSFNY